jgi:polysaccharide biosynthesis transport protein
VIPEPRNAAPPDPSSDWSDLGGFVATFLFSLRRHWATAIGVAASVFVAVAFHTYGQPKIYRSSATLEFEPNAPKPLSKDVENLNPGTWSGDSMEYYATQCRILGSTRVAEGAVHALDLSRDQGFLGGSTASGPPPVPVPEPAAARMLQGRLKVILQKETSLAVVEYEDTDPGRAQRVLQAVIDAYINQNLEKTVDSTTAAVAWLRNQLDTVKRELESSEMSLHEYKLDKNILSVDIEAQSNMLREQMQLTNEALTNTRIKREELSARRNELVKVSADDPSNLPASELLQSPWLQQFRQRYEDSVRERDGLLGSGKGPGHPDVQAVEARLAASRAALLSEVRNIKAVVERDLAVISRQSDGLARLSDETKKQALDLNLLEIEYNRLKRNKEHTEKLYSFILERTKENDLARMMQVKNVFVVDRPFLPDYPVRPNTAYNLGFALLAGLLLGAITARIRAVFDRTLKTPDDVESELGVACLGLLPIVGDVGGASRSRRGPARVKTNGPPELAVHDQPGGGVAEAARTIRTNLTLMDPKNPYRTILVTSGIPGEGKTTVACSIAISMANTGQKVVLVDCDLRRPRVHRVFGTSSDVGVSTILFGKSTVEESLVTSGVPNLSILPFGPPPPNPAEIFHDSRFREMLAELATRFDRVIIDSPPTLAVTDPALLSTMVDGTIMVVRAFDTTREMARRALRGLQSVGGNIGGIVLNAVDLDEHEYRYHYYYKRYGDYLEPPPPWPAPTLEGRTTGGTIGGDLN